MCQFKSLHFVSLHFPKWGRFVYKPQKIEIIVWIFCKLFFILHQKSLIPWQAIVRYLLQLAMYLCYIESIVSAIQRKKEKVYHKLDKSHYHWQLIGSKGQVSWKRWNIILTKSNLKTFWKFWNISNSENLILYYFNKYLTNFTKKWRYLKLSFK